MAGPNLERTTVAMYGPAWTLSNVATMTGRNLRRLVRVPTLLLLATVQPMMFVLLFTYGFGGAIDAPGVQNYIDYLLPGIFVLALAFGASQTAVAMAGDLSTGMVDRFRALPMARSAVLAGRTVADAVRNAFVLVLMTGLGYAIGFRFHAGVLGALGVLGLALATGLALSWINALLGLFVRDAEAANIGGILAIVPLVFTSSMFVPVHTMPDWLQVFAEVNPVTIIVDAMRALSLGGPTELPVWQALAWIAVLLVVSVPLAVRRYRRVNGH